VGLMGLAWILFGSWRGAGYLGGAFGRRGPRAGHMTPEQRELFRKAMSGEITAPQAR